jgi:hypothetical protein
MKLLLLIPLTVTAALAAAEVVCRLAGLQSHLRDLVTAGVVAVVAAEAAMILVYSLRKSSPVIVAQAALGGTVVHFLLTILLAVALTVAKVVEPGGAFIYCLTGAYWFSLAMLVWGLLGIVPGRTTGAQAKQNGN